MSLLEELKHDLVDPVKTFAEEVYDDTIGDAKRFYSAQAKKVQHGVRSAEKRTKEKTAAFRREQEEMKKRRKKKMKQTAIILAVLAVIVLVIFSLALSQNM